MSVIDEMNQKMFYAEGPLGQRVVIVPPAENVTEKDRKVDQYYCCIGIAIFMATFFCLMGSVYTGVGTSFDTTFGGLSIAGVALLGVAALLIGAAILCHRRVSKIKAKRISKYMHEDVSVGRRDLEEQDRRYFQI